MKPRNWADRFDVVHTGAGTQKRVRRAGEHPNVGGLHPTSNPPTCLWCVLYMLKDSKQ